MRCSKARAYISDALDSRLDERHALDLSGHLDDCPDCLRHQQLLTDARVLLRQEEAVPSENFEWKVQLKIQQALREKAADPEPVRGWGFWRPALASAAGVAVVVLVAGGLILSPPTGQSPATGPAAPGSGMRLAESQVADPPAAKPDLSGGVRRQPLHINATSSGFGIRTVADESFVNRSPYPDPFPERARWRQEGDGQALEVYRVVGSDGEVYFVFHRRVPQTGAGLKLEPHRSTLQTALPVIPVADSRQDPDS